MTAAAERAERQSKATLDECIKTFLLPESLVGDNKYRCSRCGQLRNATRQTRLKALPPLLHISLLRFTFDPKTYTRRKSNAIINFSKKLSLGGQAYQLQAIVTHQGNSVSQDCGHTLTVRHIMVTLLQTYGMKSE